MHILHASTAHMKTRRKSKASTGKQKGIYTAQPCVSGVAKHQTSRWRSIPHPYRQTFLSKHHDLAEKRKGTKTLSNIVLLWYDRHSSWHALWGLMTISEIICFLRSKKYYLYDSKLEHWERVMGNKTRWEAIDLLHRLKRAKLAQRKHGV